MAEILHGSVYESPAARLPQAEKLQPVSKATCRAPTNAWFLAS
jgi:hypothetical protein